MPEKTREVLTADGWYISGDVFRRDADGAYFFVGRTDDMFVCGGENVFPGEVEHLLERHPDILQACVVPVPDEIKGEKPFAFVVLKSGSTLTEDDSEALRARARPRRISIRAGSVSSMRCRSPDRTRSTARASNSAPLQLWQAGNTVRPHETGIAAAISITPDASSTHSRTARRSGSASDFSLTPVSRQRGAVPGREGFHPWATANRCVILRDTYLELIGVVDPAAFNPWAKFIAKNEGLHILALRCATRRLHTRFCPTRTDALLPPVPRERVLDVDGEPRTMRFRNIFSRDDVWPEARYLVIEHQTPEFLWQPRYQRARERRARSRRRDLGCRRSGQRSSRGWTALGAAPITREMTHRSAHNCPAAVRLTS